MSIRDSVIRETPERRSLLTEVKLLHLCEEAHSPERATTAVEQRKDLALVNGTLHDLATAYVPSRLGDFVDEALRVVVEQCDRRLGH
jgi:hypothetical protein